MEDEADNTATDYETVVRSYTDEELLSKERSKRRRKTGDVVGTGLTSLAAIEMPALWAIAGSNAKSYLSNSGKHKIILNEISRRGLSPIKENLSDTILPILTSAGSMYLGRAMGGTAGQGAASQAGNLLQSIGTRAFNGFSKSDKKDKAAKKAAAAAAAATAAGTAVTTQVARTAPSPAPEYSQLQTPALYHIPADQPPPATLTYYYVPPTAQYPRGYYAPAPVQTSTPPMLMQPASPAVQQASPVAQQAQQTHQMPPALQYQYAPPQPQYFRDASGQVYAQQVAPMQGLRRSQSVYEPQPVYQPTLQRPQSFMYY